ncbi:GIY-YIG nuclease family protein, partial [Candidatus Microgenomates bacterium]|nr:GIY-YIG nuclease family protein [Candidatus Microgenomates bacterium]
MTLKIPNTIEDIKKLDSFAGVYLYLLKGKPLYIGKSTHVKVRLLSHAENAKSDRKEAAYVDVADEIECIQTDSELRALLLESQLIQTHHPKYNVRWRDDKSYLYIKITVKEDFPKIYLVRRESDKHAKYFGPFSSTKIAGEILKEIRRVFPFCTSKKIGKLPCFYSKIGLCEPCPNVSKAAEDKRRYRANIKQIIRTLKGESTEVLAGLYKRLEALSEDERYEEALELRNKIIRFE